MPVDPKIEVRERLKQQGNACPLCRRSKAIFPGLKFVPDRDRSGKLRGVLCERCKKGVDAFPDPQIMFQAIVYLRGGV